MKKKRDPIYQMTYEELKKYEKRIYKKVSNEELIAYSECFTKPFTAIYQRAEKHICIKFYQNVLNNFVVFELSVLNGISDNTIDFIEDIDSDKTLLSKFSVFSHNDKFHQIRDVIHFSDNSFFIIKPNLYKYWHPAIAELDLSDAMEQIMNDSGVKIDGRFQTTILKRRLK